MRVLITGASGMIGSAVSKALLERGDEVVGLTRNPVRARAGNPAVEWHPWQSESEPAPTAAVEGADGVVNLVGEPINQRLTADAKRRIQASRIAATDNLVTAILAASEPPSTLVSQSAVGYYGDTGDKLVTESSPSGKDFLARLPQQWEKAAQAALGPDTRIALMRTGHVLDPSGGFLKQLLLPFRLGLGGPIASGDQYLPWIHIADQVGLTLLLLDDALGNGPFNSCSPNPVTSREFGKTLGRVLHRPAVLPIPKLAVSLIRGRELATAIAGGQRTIPEHALRLGYEFKFPELEPALRDLLDR